MTLALAQTAHVFNSRSRTRSLVTAHFPANRWLWGATVLCVLLQVLAVTVPPMRDVLRTTALDGADWALVSACALAPVVIVEVVKFVQRRTGTGWTED
jgi:P-type Ca2+ transporter type 2C